MQKSGCCCYACHFRWEEENLLPQLRRRAPDLAARIQLEHDQMRQHKARTGRWPKAQVDAHHHFEDQILPMIFPELAAEIARQHHELEKPKAGGGCGC